MAWKVLTYLVLRFSNGSKPLDWIMWQRFLIPKAAERSSGSRSSGHPKWSKGLRSGGQTDSEWNVTPAQGTSAYWMLGPESKAISTAQVEIHKEILQFPGRLANHFHRRGCGILRFGRKGALHLADCNHLALKKMTV